MSHAHLAPGQASQRGTVQLAPLSLVLKRSETRHGPTAAGAAPTTAHHLCTQYPMHITSATNASDGYTMRTTHSTSLDHMQSGAVHHSAAFGP